MIINNWNKYRFRASDISVRFGTSKHQSGGQFAKPGRLNIHPKYDPDTLDYDVAVILLAEGIPESNISQSVALTDSEPEGGTEVVISGWGDLEVSCPKSIKYTKCCKDHCTFILFKGTRRDAGRTSSRYSTNS